MKEIGETFSIRGKSDFVIYGVIVIDSNPQKQKKMGRGVDDCSTQKSRLKLIMKPDWKNTLHKNLEFFNSYKFFNHKLLAATSLYNEVIL